MKHLLNGVAIAAALAIAAPAAWAQAPMTPKAAPAAPKAAAPAAPAAGAPMAPTASKQRHKRGGKRYARRGGAVSMTDQLNREELARIQSGAPPMAPTGTSAGQPNELRGIPGAGQPSASEHPAMPR
jgi:hypothetical protein